MKKAFRLVFFAVLFLSFINFASAISLICNSSTGNSSNAFILSESAEFLGPLLRAGAKTTVGTLNTKAECDQKEAQGCSVTIKTYNCTYTCKQPITLSGWDNEQECEDLENNASCDKPAIRAWDDDDNPPGCKYNCSIPGKGSGKATCDSKAQQSGCTVSNIAETCDYSCTEEGTCPFTLSAYALSAPNTPFPSSIPASYPVTAAVDGSSLDYTQDFDLDEMWSIFGLNPTNIITVPFLKFVSDPFVLLNGTQKNPYWKFHDEAKTASVNCKSQDSAEGITSDVECVTYPISKKLADCRGDIPNNKCCGDDDLVDPGFEANPDNQEKYLSNMWEVSGSGNCTKKEGGFCYTDNQNHTGSKSYTLSSPDEGQAKGAKIQQTADMTSNQMYYVSAYAKTSKSTGAGINTKNNNINIFQGTNNWRHYWLPFTSQNNEQITFYSGASQPAIFQLWVDDFHLLGKDMDLGDIQKIDMGPDMPAVYNLCYFDGTEWSWIDGSIGGNAFKIKTIAGFDLISNTLRWQACNARGMAGAVYSGDRFNDTDLIGDNKIATFIPPESVPSVVIPGEITTPDYNFEDPSTTVIIDENEFLAGLQVSDIQPPGAPVNCYNNETDGEETDKNCGNGCAQCSEGKNCSVNEDCFSRICSDEKICIPPTPPNLLDQTQYLAKRFMCAKQDELDAFAECCGLSLGNCKNPESLSKIRRTGNTIYTIYEFLKKTDYLNSVNYVLMFGLQLQTTVDYNLPMFIESSTKKGADTRITNWSDYDYLEFYIYYANPPIGGNGKHYLQLLILNETFAFPPRNYSEGRPSYVENSVLFRGYIDDFIVNQQDERKWLHVKIPIKSISDKNTSIKKNDNVKFISIFAKLEDVPSEKQASHSAFPPGTYRNIIAVDRIFLSKSGTEGNSKSYYCAKYPPFNSSKGYFGSYWTDNMDEKEIDITQDEEVGKSACDSTTGYGWTGNACCGDDTTNSLAYLTNINKIFVGESFADDKGGCIKGAFIENNSVMAVKYNKTSAGEASLLFFNKTFYSCNKQSARNYIIRELNYTPSAEVKKIKDALTDISSPECYNKGSWYCDFDSYWKNATAIAGEVINKSHTLPFNILKGCCPSSYCFAGQTYIPGKPSNQTGAVLWNASCLPSQANYFYANETLGLPYFFNLSKVYYYPAVKGNNNSYRCVNGSWQPAVLKWNPDHTEQGYCPSLSQCYFNSTSCKDNQEFSKDSFCDNGNWTSRTKYVASQLLNLVNPAGNYTLYCDTYDKVLTQFGYIEETLSPYPAKRILLGDVIEGSEFGEKYKCPNFEGNDEIHCTNNFCALRYATVSEGEKVAIGTSLNIPVDNIERPDYSTLNIFKEATKTAGSSHNDFCDQAIIISNQTGNFTGCRLNDFVAPGAGDANIWINNKTQTLIYIKQGDNLVPDTAGQVFLNLFKHPIQTAYFILWNNYIYENSLNDTSDFLKSLADFRRLYISSLNDKEIRGIVEEAGTSKKMLVSYKSINTNLCYDSTTMLKLGLGTGLGFTGAQCMVYANKTADGKLYFTQNYLAYDDTNWKDLTTNTRIQLAEPAGEIPGFEVEIAFSNYIELGNEVTFDISATSPIGEELFSLFETMLAYFYDFGDGNSFSTMVPTPPEPPMTLLSHSYSNPGVYTPAFGVISKDYGIALFTGDTCEDQVKVVPPVQDNYYILEDGKITINMTDYVAPTGSVQIEMPPDSGWLGCTADDNVLACTPEANTSGTGTINMTLAYCNADISKNITIIVLPANDPPYFTQPLPNQSFIEDYNFSLGLPFEISLSDYAADNETPKEELLFSLENPPFEGDEFGCNVLNGILSCTGNGIENWNGAFDLAVKVKDLGDGSDETRLSSLTAFTVNVTSVNDAPTIFFPEMLEVQRGQSRTWSWFVDDADLNFEGDSLELNCSAFTLIPPISPIPSAIDNNGNIFCELKSPATVTVMKGGQTATCIQVVAFGNLTILNAGKQIITRTITPVIPCPVGGTTYNINVTSTLTAWINLTVKDSANALSHQIVSVISSSQPLSPLISVRITSHPSGTKIISEQENVTFNVTATDPNSNDNLTVAFSITPAVPAGTANLSPNSSPINYYEGNFTWQTPDLAGQTEKKYAIMFNATDNTGKTAKTTYNITLNDLPTGSISHIFNSATGNYTFTVSVSDLRGQAADNLSFCEIQFGDGQAVSGPCDSDSATVSIDHNYSTIPSGTHYQPFIRLTDDLGATVEINDSAQIGDDTQAPSVSIQSPVNNRFYKSSVNVIFTATDDVGIDKCWYLLNGTRGEIPNCQSLSISLASEGSYALNVSANDTANKIATSNTVTFTSDQTLPVVTINSPAGGTTTNTLIFVDITATDNANLDKRWITVTNSLEVITKYSYTVPAQLPDIFPPDFYTIRAYANDSANNIGEASPVVLTITTS